MKSNKMQELEAAIRNNKDKSMHIRYMVIHIGTSKLRQAFQKLFLYIYAEDIELMSF